MSGFVYKVKYEERILLFLKIKYELSNFVKTKGKFLLLSQIILKGICGDQHHNNYKCET